MTIEEPIKELADELTRYGDEDHEANKRDGARAYWHAAAKIRALTGGDND